MSTISTGMTFTPRRWAFLLLAAALCVGQARAQSPTPASDAIIAQAKALNDARKFREAFDLLSPLEPQRAGDPAFDLPLGIAAVEIGEGTRAVFALERVVLVEPTNVVARAELARAYFLIGENRAAREEFQNVRSAQLPPQVANTVDRFLDALNSRERALRDTGLFGYVEVGTGQDSNANAASSASSFGVPAFGGAQFAVGQASRSTRAWFNSVATGISYRHKLTPALVAFGSLNANERFVNGNNRFDLGGRDATGGMTLSRGSNEYTGAFQWQETLVDNNPFRRANGFTLQWRRTLDQFTQVSAYYQRAKLSYPGQRTRDAIRDVVGIAFAKTFDVARSPAIFGSIYGGDEKANNNVGFPHHGHHIWGVRVGGQLVLSATWVGFVNASVETRRHKGADPLFLVRRDDEDWNLRVGARYTPAENWTITPQVSYNDNRANFASNDFSRWIVSVTARYDFR